MKIVIDVDEDIYNYIQTEGYDEHSDKRFDYQIRFAVKDGTPLPKGHGRLIDADALLKEHRDLDAYPFPSITIQNAPTIIEADKEVKKNEDSD